MQGEPSCSLELWLQAGVTNSLDTILSFSAPENPLQFAVLQYRSNLALRRTVRLDRHRSEMIGVDGVFSRTKLVFITITSGHQKTSVYVDGALADSFQRFRFGTDCTGQLVLGTSPVRNERWTGELKGLAMYQSELTPAEALQHYKSWTTQGRPDVSENEHAMAVYLFDERAGSIAHNDVTSGIALYIPKRYSLLHQMFLEPFWKEYKPGRTYWSDTLVNIVGFIPLGFFFYAYWSFVRPIKHAALIVIGLGLAVSLTIEVLQSYLPTRASGTTDLITNTFGTFIGVKLCAPKFFRDLFPGSY